MLPVAVDAMGGDDAPGPIVAGACRAHQCGWPVLLVGDKRRIEPLLPRKCNVEILHCEQSIPMEDRAAASVRRLPDASVRRCMQQLREGRVRAVLTAGNTGAAMVSARLDLGFVDGVERPAVATVLPRADGGRLVLLDAGANVDCRPEQLCTFAHLGVAYARSLGLDERVGLLSNGSEPTKGNLQVRATHPMLAAEGLTFVGNIEPSTAMNGGCEVLVCDGFVGNILLKAAEGAVETVVQLLKREIRRRTSSRIGALLLRGAFARFRRVVAWDAHGGALLLGVDGVVVIAHGRANSGAIEAAVRMAHQAADSRLGESVVEQLRSRL